jgi:GNAT superfamily N-acetyltransferase
LGSSAEGLIIRPAQPGDRPAMERICAHTWDCGDYIPEVWDDWLDDEGGTLVVGELDGQVVALSRIAYQPGGQIWLEAMRVDPEFRRRGIAARFLDHHITHARQRGARVVRLGTGGNNKATQILTGRAGMECIGTYVLWHALPQPGASRVMFLTPDHHEQVRAFLRASPVLAHTHGLYGVDWVWQELIDERLAQFLEGGQVAAHFAPGGDLAALAWFVPEPGAEVLWVGFADGDSAAVTALAGASRVRAAQLGAEKVQVMLPDLPWLRDAFHAAGFGSGDWEGELWIFELWLTDVSHARQSHGGGTTSTREFGRDR